MLGAYKRDNVDGSHGPEPIGAIDGEVLIPSRRVDRQSVVVPLNNEKHCGVRYGLNKACWQV
jgi:hypothetical protein